MNSADLSWSWSQSSGGSSAVIQNRDTVLFHPTYSSGTAAVRGDTGLVRPYHYYWEVKMVREVYGTDVMVGLATKDFNLALHSNNFASLIGCDKESWGYSFHGYRQHNGTKTDYGSGWGIGDIVGVHYDSWRGNIQFYINRRPLGLAWEAVRAQEMFPVVSSTAAKSEVKLITALSFPNSLQFECFKALSEKLPKSDLLNVYIPPGLRGFIRNNYWFLVMNRKSPCAELDDSTEEIQERKRQKTQNLVRKLKSKKFEVLTSDSEDESECFINIRKKKLDLMKKNCHNVPETLQPLSTSLSQSPPACSSQVVHYTRSQSSSDSLQNLQLETTAATKPSTLRIKKKLYLKR